MIDKRDPFEYVEDKIARLPLRARQAIGAIALVGTFVVGFQVGENQAHRPEEPEYTFNPITWVANPISDGVEAISNLVE